MAAAISPGITVAVQIANMEYRTRTLPSPSLRRPRPEDPESQRPLTDGPAEKYQQTG